MLEPSEHHAYVENAQLPMAEVEGEGHTIRTVNAAFCRLLGRSREDLVGRTFDQLVPRGHGCMDLLDEVLRTGEPRSYVKVREEDPIYWSYTCLPIKEGEAPRGVMVQVTESASFAVQATEINQALLISSIRQQELTASAERLNEQLQELIEEREQDLDKHKQLARQLREQAVQLAETDRRKSEFLAILAHELRNPLAPLRSGLELLSMSRGDLPAWDRTHAMMNRQLARMVRLIDELMDLSRITRGVIPLRMERIDLRPLIEEALETSRSLRDRHGHTLELHLPQHALYVRGDGMRLTQVFTNLLNNAAKYTDNGGTIAVHAEVRGQEVVVCVKDNGIGIPAAELGRVFEMFSQVDQANDRAQGGLGIGLHIVKHLVEMHQGRMEVRSEGPGRGSSFSVHLPLLVEQADQEAQAPATAAAQSAPAPLRILVVDDNMDAAEMLVIMLGKRGHEVRVAHNGQQALEAGDRMMPDIVLMDLGMPVMDGRTACRKMRRTAWGRAATIIAITGWGQEEDRLQSAAAGFDHHLVKPISMEALLAVFEQVHKGATP